MCELEIIMCEADLERGEDKKVMGGIDKVQDGYKINKRNGVYTNLAKPHWILRIVREY